MGTYRERIAFFVGGRGKLVMDRCHQTKTTPAEQRYCPSANSNSGYEGEQNSSHVWSIVPLEEHRCNECDVPTQLSHNDKHRSLSGRDRTSFPHHDAEP
jgi:hypothetical protein